MLFQEMISALDIHLLAFGRRKPGEQWNYRNVNNYYNRLILVMKGTATVRHHGTEFSLAPGDVHLVPCFTSADYISTCGQLDLYYLHFTSRTFGGLDICQLQDCCYQCTARPIDNTSFKELHRLNPSHELPVLDPSIGVYRLHHDELEGKYHQLSPQLHLENMAYISLILAPFFKGAPHASTSKAEAKRITEFADYVEKNLHRPLGLEEIAQTLNLNPTYLSDWLFSVLKVRPVEYINRRRVEKAQLLLITTTCSIKEIANQLGFTSSTYFARVFKTHLGVSASRYRELNRQTESVPQSYVELI